MRTTQGCIRREGTSEVAPEAVRQALEEVAKAVGGGYCRLQMPLRLALGVRKTVAGRRLGALKGGGGYLPPFHCIPGTTPPSFCHVLFQRDTSTAPGPLPPLQVQRTGIMNTMARWVRGLRASLGSIQFSGYLRIPPFSPFSHPDTWIPGFLFTALWGSRLPLGKMGKMGPARVPFFTHLPPISTPFSSIFLSWNRFIHFP